MEYDPEEAGLLRGDRPGDEIGHAVGRQIREHYAEAYGEQYVRLPLLLDGHEDEPEAHDEHDHGPPIELGRAGRLYEVNKVLQLVSRKGGGRCRCPRRSLGGVFAPRQQRVDSHDGGQGFVPIAGLGPRCRSPPLADACYRRHGIHDQRQHDEQRESGAYPYRGEPDSLIYDGLVYGDPHGRKLRRGLYNAARQAVYGGRREGHASGVRLPVLWGAGYTL